MTRKLLLLVAALAAAGTAHLTQRSADELRHRNDLDSALLFLPSPASFELATMGFHEPVADLLWVRSVLIFGERHGRDADPAWGHWLAGMIEAIARLDPSWMTPYQYGGTMLRSLGDIDGSDRIFELGMEAMPDVAFFPFALGMNQYLHRDDPQAAVKWINIAAEKPDAPRWYRVAAAGLLAKSDMIPVAVRFLEEQRAATTDPALLEMIDGRLVRLRHDGWTLKFEQARQQYRDRYGVDLAEPVDLEQLGYSLPPDPHGGHWVLGADGALRSSVREAEMAEKARQAERALLARP